MSRVHAKRVKAVLGVLLLAAVVSATSGCNPFRKTHAETVCKGPEGYADARNAPGLKIPPGLESPDTRNALRIPELNTPEPRRRLESEGCLDEPPSFVIAKPKEPEA